jgi:hypothetical protein
MTVVMLDTRRILDWNTFHDVFAEAFGFPDFYGRNMNAWIDCMSSLGEPRDAMTSVHAPGGRGARAPARIRERLRSETAGTLFGRSRMRGVRELAEDRGGRDASPRAILQQERRTRSRLLSRFDV